MTGPRRSPSSPLVQTEQGHNLDGKAIQAMRSGPSPSNVGMPASSSLFEHSSPNYFGLAVENAHDSHNFNTGPHTQKNWGSLPRAQSSLPSPKLQLYSQESVSEGLANLLKTESDLDKGRRQTAFQSRSFNGEAPAIRQNSLSIPSAQETSDGRELGSRKPRGSFSQGS